MASVPVKPLDGPAGYLRWKESLLLRAHSLGVARVLFEDRPAGGDDAAAKKWARDDAICRGHILAALSDRLLPDYARFATAADLWRALERTYGVDTPSVWEDKFREFSFDERAPFLEQLAHAEALGVAAGLSDRAVAFGLRAKLPEAVMNGVVPQPGFPEKGMGLVWDVARVMVSAGEGPEFLWGTAAMADDPEGSLFEGPGPGQNAAGWNQGQPGNTARNHKRTRRA
ncbi:hypothetical protein ACP70R_047586 [Stipagrostis hirtigluma subsp. patula]